MILPVGGLLCVGLRLVFHGIGEVVSVAHGWNESRRCASIPGVVLPMVLRRRRYGLPSHRHGRNSDAASGNIMLGQLPTSVHQARAIRAIPSNHIAVVEVAGYGSAARFVTDIFATDIAGAWSAAVAVALIAVGTAIIAGAFVFGELKRGPVDACVVKNMLLFHRSD